MNIKQFVIIQERSNGNESVGDMWVDTYVFSPETTLSQVWEKVCGPGYSVAGRTMIRPDETTIHIPELF